MTYADEQRPYRNSSLPTDQRVDDLLDRMTLSEKVGQLVGTWAGDLDPTKDLEDVEADEEGSESEAGETPEIEDVEEDAEAEAEALLDEMDEEVDEE